MQMREAYPLKWALLAGSILIAIASPSLVSKYYTRYTTSRELAQNPTPPRFEDVNSDGIQDKIIKTQVYIPGFIGRYTLGDEVLLGMNIKGKIVYLPRHVYDTFQAYASSVE